MRLTFAGGASTVTGSNFLVTDGDTKILVDCGLEQGGDFSVEEMYGPFPFDPHAIHALVVTHAHLDHVGRIPKLVREGFTGTIWSTEPTKALAEYIMRDSAGIMGGEAKRMGREPLYVDADVDAALKLWQTLPYHEEKEVASNLSIYLRNTGHILGSASVRIKTADGLTLALTGDIGNSPSPLLPDWEPITDADAIVMESTYGNRAHPELANRVPILLETFQKAIARGGTILVPAFSMERTQLMLYELSNFFSEGKLPKIPVYLDSPLAIEVTQVYEKYGPTYFKPETEAEIKKEGDIFTFPFLTQTPSRGESEAIAKVAGPKIIIAGAGMSHGGRIGRWEQMYLEDPKTTLLIVGYQAPGSPGRMLAEGLKSVRIEGKQVTNNAQVVILEGWSAHADRDELLQFATACLKDKRPKAIFTALGEPAAERFLAQRIHDYAGGNAIVPLPGETWEVTKDSVKKI
jgi:metallo-beta-lactamase family protein